MVNTGNMDDMRNLFKETIAEFMENSLEAELDDNLGYSEYDYKKKAMATKHCVPVFGMWRCLFP